MCDCKRATMITPWHRHAKLIVEQCARRETMRRLREQAGLDRDFEVNRLSVELRRVRRDAVGFAVGLLLVLAAFWCLAVVLS